MRKLVVSLLAALALVVGLLAPLSLAGTAQAATAPSSAPATGKQAQTAKAAPQAKKKKHKKKKKASQRVWNRLAQCESGGRWKINTGNGYYGGLQISPSTWAGFGGKRFAGLPHKATKAEQIKVGKRIRHGQGWGAWPHCSRAIGVR